MQPASTKRNEPAVETIQVFTVHEVTGKYLAALEVISSLYIYCSLTDTNAWFAGVIFSNTMASAGDMACNST